MGLIWTCSSSVSNVSAAFFSSMTEANFRTSSGKTVSTTHSIKGSASSLLYFKRKQWSPGSFNKAVSLCSRKISSYWFSERFTSPKRSLYFIGTKFWIIFFTVFFLVLNCLVNIPWHEALFSINMHWLSFFAIKLKWFYNWKLDWKAHLFLFRWG